MGVGIISLQGTVHEVYAVDMSQIPCDEEPHTQYTVRKKLHTISPNFFFPPPLLSEGSSTLR